MWFRHLSLASLIAFFERIGLAGRISGLMPFAYNSPNAIPPAQTLVAFMISVVAGARRLAHTDWLRADRALHALLGIERFPGTDTVRADSGFFENALLTFLESRGIPYIVVARLTQTVKRNCKEFAFCGRPLKEPCCEDFAFRGRPLKEP